MTLIHTALLCEAQSFIEKYKLKKTNLNPKIYSNDEYIVLISGVGKENTISSIEYIFKNYKISKAINIGVAGVSDKSISIGEMFCCNHKLNGIKWLPLETVDMPQTKHNTNEITLYDMETKYFLDISREYLDENNILVFKVVSDYLSSDILAKDFIKKLIKNSTSSLIDSFI
ncbi:MAG: hypothetical protein U9R16_00010 [Campylobacterota bacterium]|nr:hypothetical protein [Campylobacterota bacterium]